MADKKLIIGITAEGSVNLLNGQLAYFKSLGYETYLLAPYSERSANFCIKEGCEHLIINIERDISVWKDLKTLWCIIKIFRDVKPDVVNLGTPKVSLLGMIAAALLDVKRRIYTCRGFRFEHERGFKRQVLMFMEKVTSFFAQDVVCISDSVQDLGIKHKIFSRNKSVVLCKGSSNGVHLSLFNPTNVDVDRLDEVKAYYSLSNKFVFGFVGRIVDRKGINELIHVFELMYPLNNELRLLLVGPFEMDQISNKFILEAVDKHPGIISIGSVPQDEVPLYMSLMDVFVLPAWWEGFGNVLIQAAAMGVPVISTTATGTKDAVADGFNGVLVPAKNTEELQKTMLRLRNDDKIREELGRNGPIWAKNFDSTLIWDSLHQLYCEK